MNSMSKKYYDSCSKEKEREEEKCPTIIKCGCPSTITLPAVAAAAVAPVNVTVASLTVDTSCICDPVVKLDFSSVFTNLLAIAAGTTVSLQVFRRCGNQAVPTPVGPSWPLVSGIAVLALGTINYPSFHICDSDACFSGGCCSYTVVATISGVLVAAAATLSNATLTATITCRSNECTRNCNSKKRYHCECE